MIFTKFRPASCECRDVSWYFIFFVPATFFYFLMPLALHSGTFRANRDSNWKHYQGDAELLDRVWHQEKHDGDGDGNVEKNKVTTGWTLRSSWTHGYEEKYTASIYSYILLQNVLQIKNSHNFNFLPPNISLGQKTFFSIVYIKPFFLTNKSWVSRPAGIM